MTRRRRPRAVAKITYGGPGYFAHLVYMTGLMSRMGETRLVSPLPGSWSAGLLLLSCVTDVDESLFVPVGSVLRPSLCTRFGQPMDGVLRIPPGNDFHFAGCDPSCPYCSVTSR